MATSTVTLLGLGITGTSLGLALHKAQADIEIVGHDKTPEATQAARKAGAVQRGEWNLHKACAGASIIVLAMPLGEIDETLELIGEDLRPDTLLLVLTDAFKAAAAMIDARLGDRHHAVLGHPIRTDLTGLPTPRADLFDKAVFCLAAGAATDAGALELASSFVETVGAQPLFMDPVEHDGIMAGVEAFPQLLGAALMHMLAASPGWLEARRLAGRRFAQVTALDRSAENLAAGLRANRANVLLRLEQFQRELAAWKQWLEADPVEGSEDPLLVALSDTARAREQWEAQAILHEWDPVSAPAAEGSSPGMLRQLFLGGFGAKRSPEKGDKS